MKTIDDHMREPNVVPLVISCDLVGRLQGLDLQEKCKWFVDLVACRIADTGNHVDDLTVRELRNIIDECTVASNAAAKRKLYWFKYR